mgnify:CR=1 FL=1
MKHLLPQIRTARGIILRWIAMLAVVPCTPVMTQVLTADGPKEKSASGSFVSFRDGTLTLKGKSGPINFEHIGAKYKTFENNESGPGSKLVDTADALRRVAPGMVFRVSVEDREIIFGLDHRVIGTFESYRDGKLNLLAADVPPGFVRRPAGNVSLTIDPEIPVLESLEGGDYNHAGPAGEILKKIKHGTLLTCLLYTSPSPRD